MISLLSDVFFTKEVEDNAVLYTCRTNVFRENRTRDIPDEVAIAKKQQEAVEAFEASRDITFDEFKFQFEDHIEGRAANNRTARPSNLGDDVKSKRSASQRSKSRKRGVSQSGEDDDSKSQRSRRADQETAD